MKFRFSVPYSLDDNAGWRVNDRAPIRVDMMAHGRVSVVRVGAFSISVC
jgi:hypothetical protein